MCWRLLIGGGGVQVPTTGGDQRLVLMERDGGRGTDAPEVQAAPFGEQGLVPRGDGDTLDLGLMTADVRQLAHVFG